MTVDDAVMSMEEEDILATSARLDVGLSSLNLDSIHLPPREDHLGIISDDDDEDLKEESDDSEEEDFGNIIVVDNLPIVSKKQKFDKLEAMLGKIFTEAGAAELAKEKINGYKLGRSSYILTVSMFDDIEKFMKVPEEWPPLETKPYTTGENLQEWLFDEKARDQFVIRASSDTEILWNDARQSMPDPVYKRSDWTESFVKWSPLGTYLATIHRQGAAVWGGATTFNRLMRYAHPQVQLIDFSPGERFLVTYNSHEPSNLLDTHEVVINIFDVRTGKVKREFKESADKFATEGSRGVTPSRPIFRWGGGKEDKYFARINKNGVSVYETKTFSLIDEKPIEVENVMDFGWSPTDPILALFVPKLGGGNQPARVSLVQIPGKEELRQKNLFSVCDCTMYWQSNGDYLAVKVDRYKKGKKRTYAGFELFRIKERDIPIEVLELENKNDKIIAFAWEPKGHRFAVIHGDNLRPDVSFYSMRSGTKTGRVSKLTTLKGKQANALFWSPGGQFIILAGLKGLNGQLEFYDVDELQTMAQVEHFMATDVEWDPTGRYVATAVTSFHEMENGYNVWSFSGKLLYRILKDHFFQLLWRPRPPSLLSVEKEEEIANNLKYYSKKYEAEDLDVSMLLSEQDRQRRKMLKEEWESCIGEWKRLHEEDKLERQNLRDAEASDEEEEERYEDKEVEELLDVSEEVISFD
ncbi:hypothetical protein BUALT_Bualt08G0014700 [Buddleja alternifolia]|uniref:Eukaryotic translation initiation factor 3 subunit B n=1 Tax=Buddleja alternifolia TaxID=168488 RepID=A0AAV6X465_9LAMI|nr:hypothetical protein BUALT_Bualt08G0014700 [Buddleja alternifolia]